MKAQIIGLSKGPAGDSYNLLLNYKGKTHTARLGPDEAGQLLAQGKFKEVESGIYRSLTKNRPPTLVKDLKRFVNKDYGRGELYEDIEEWIRYVTLSTDENHLPSPQYFDLLLFLYQLKDILKPGETYRVSAGD